MIHDASTIYPGTSRELSVYVPHQYDGNSPACLLVCMDGPLFDAPAKLDTLISDGRVPVTIAIFINPGVVKDADGRVLRYNRCREFDTLSPTWADFIESEILPKVQGLKLDDGRIVLISPHADDHAIAGASSGGICAFAAAWFRPDLFSRVYSAVGTFVSMRGGHQLPAVIRKSEPQRLRIFLQDGKNDAWNPLFGSWWEYNQLMYSALSFSGYQVGVSWDDGGHSIYYGTQAFKSAMEFLWEGWPEPVAKPHSSNDMLSTILDDENSWQVVSAYSAAADTLFNEPKLPEHIKIGSIDAMGIHFAISPDWLTIVQSTPHSNWLTQYVVDGGSLTLGEPFYCLHPDYGESPTEVGPMLFDVLGNLYVATSLGIQVCDHNGRVRAILTPTGRSVSKIAFVGNTLYALSQGMIYCRKMEVSGYDLLDGPISFTSQGQG
ncbi:MAG: alpha/beta hydrolase-fold protein [Muribaculaceae bacterium]